MDLAWDQRRSGPASGRASEGLIGRVPSNPRVVDGEVLPLLASLATDDSAPNHLRSAALLAAARQAQAGSLLDRAARHDRISKLQELLSDGLTNSSRDIQEASILGLGLVGSGNAMQVLSALALDTDAGRQAVQTDDRVPVRFRALAAYSLGLSAQRSDQPTLATFAVHQLENLLGDEDAMHVDLGTATILALGLIPSDKLASDDDMPALDDLGKRLLKILRDPRGDRNQQARIPTALARLNDGFSDELQEQISAELVAALEKRSKLPRAAARSAALALGQLGDADNDATDKLIRKGLEQALKSRDAMVRRYAALSLARVGSRAGQDADAPFAHAPSVAKTLSRNLARGRSADEPWNALALGVFAYYSQAAGLDSHHIASMLKSALGSAKSSDRAPALALAAGMAGTQTASDLMGDRFERFADDQALGMLGIAIGMTGNEASLESLREASAEAHHRPERRAELALGRAILGDSQLVPELLQQLEECDCWASTRGSARGLARVGDTRALAPLMRIARDTERGDRQRAEAVHAMGWIASGDTAPWSDPLVTALDPLGAPDTLTDPTGFGVLDRQ